MINNAVLIYSEYDPNLKLYFKTCADRTSYLLNQKPHISQSEVYGEKCNFAFINDVELAKHEDSSLIVIYSHGYEGGFCKEKNSTSFLNINMPVPNCLKEGLLYTNACSAGKAYGIYVIEGNGSFYGYNRDVIVSIDFERIFIDCDIQGIHHLVEGLNLKETKKLVQEKYTLEIDRLYRNNLLAASNLMDARDSLTIYGDLNKSFF